ncbi:ATP-binding protein, partial [Salmonella enterica]|uniref:ATP-binding protein n=1 Tax=Salmonella enterica TaxID=28901 RepID=UPI003D267899
EPHLRAAGGGAVQRAGGPGRARAVPVRRGVHEVITNAVRHGGGAGRIRLWRDGPQLHCQVIDSGAGIPAERRASTRR